ncbi:MAG: amino acid permease [Gemmatimonadota bacterium]
MAAVSADDTLEKQLGVRDVYAVATGAMFSSGFFLLPGIAAAGTGPSVVLAYLVAGVLVVPALLSLAELSGAMPRAGGAYYFLDRSLGPMVGTVGGLGTWVAQVFKSAFAFVGIGAYLSLFVEVPIREVTVVLIGAFVALNIVGAKETTRLQQFLVWTLLAVVVGFVAVGLGWTVSEGPGEVARRRFTPFFTGGVEGLVSTVGLVFVSYAGLTKVAGIAEEVRDPDRNIPRGMILSLLTATVLYVLGVLVMAAVLDPAGFHEDLTPVATTVSAVLDGTRETVALTLVVAAAFAAFASTGNAGVMSASRYLLAMARDDHIWSGLTELGRHGTPTRALVVTGAAMAISILAFDVEAVAKLGSAFLLLVFALVNLSVIVMRESWIDSYEPGFRSPGYPWMQIVGFLVPFVLIALMGWLAGLFVMGVAGAGIVWYHFYVREHLEREGAIYHVFERLGRRRYEGLEPELRQILKEKALGGTEPFEEAVAGAVTVELEDDVTSFSQAVEEAAGRFEKTVPVSTGTLTEGFLDEARMGMIPVAHGAALPHLRVEGVSEPRLVMLRSRRGIPVDVRDEEDGGRDRATPDGEETARVHALFFLVSPESASGAHLHILAQIAGHVETEGFLEDWLAAEDREELKEVLLHEDRFLTLKVGRRGPTARLAGTSVRDVEFPDEVLLVLVERGGVARVPRGGLELRRGDRLTFLGSEEGVEELRERYLTT